MRERNLLSREERLEDRVPGKTLQARVSGKVRWRVERKCRELHLTEGALVKQALDAYLGPIESDIEELREWKAYLGAIRQDAESLLARMGGAARAVGSPAPDESLRPTSCPECGNDFAFSALSDGSWKCGACRASGTWS